MVAKGTIKLMAAHAVLTVCGYVTVVTLARGLGPEEYGVYGIVISVLLGVELIGRLGIPQAMSKLIAEKDGPAPELEATGIPLPVVTYLAIFVLFWLFSPLMADAFGLENGAFLFRVASLDIPIYGMFFMCCHIMNGRRRFGVESVGFTIYGVAKAAGILILLYLGLSVAGALIINVIASALGLVYLAAHIPRRSFRPTFHHVRPVVRYAIPVALFLLGSQVIFNMHFWLLKIVGRHVSDETIGIYAAAINVSKLPNVIHFVMTAVLVPTISHAMSRNDFERAGKYVRGAVRFLGVFLLPVCFIIVIEARGIMSFLYSSAYAEGAHFLAILVVGMGLFFTVMMTLSAMLIGGGRPRHAAALTLGLVPVGLVLAVTFIPRFGAEGAAWSALVTSFAGTVAGGLLVRRYVGSLFIPSTVVKIVAATVLTAALAAVVPLDGVLLLPGCAGLLAFYAGLLFLFRELRREDIDLLLPGRSGEA